MENDYKKQKLQAKLLAKINDISNDIAKSQRNGVGNYMIVSSEIANAIENLNNQKLRKKKIERLLKKINKINGK